MSELGMHPDCQRFKVKVNVDLYITAPTIEEADTFAMKYVRRALSLNHQTGFVIDIPIHVGTELVKQGRVSIYKPREM